MREPSSPTTFRNAFAEQFAIPPGRFERTIFARCVPVWWRPVAVILVRVFPRGFENDLALLREVADAESWSEVRKRAGDFRSSYRHRWSFSRNVLGLRVSGRRLLGVARQVLPSNTEHPNST